MAVFDQVLLSRWLAANASVTVARFASTDANVQNAVDQFLGIMS